MLISAKGIEAAVVAKASILLLEFEVGKIRCRKLKGVGGWCIEVGYRYRLLSVDRKQWELLSHEAYNKVTSRGLRFRK